MRGRVASRETMARNPSYLSSKSQAASSNGSSRVSASIGCTSSPATARRGAPSRSQTARISAVRAAGSPSSWTARPERTEGSSYGSATDLRTCPSPVSLIKSHSFPESPLIRTNVHIPFSLKPFSSKSSLPALTPSRGSPTGRHCPRSQTIIGPAPYSPSGITPSKSAYSTGWSSVCIAKRFSAGSGCGPRGTAQDLSTPSHSGADRSACAWRCASAPRRRPGAPRRRPWAPGSDQGSACAGTPPGTWTFLQSGYHPAPMRPLATGTISFGLVSIPVKLFSATESSAAISFNMLHSKCGGRVKQQYICPREDNVVVPRDEMIKGYEFAKDRYVTFTPDELKTLEEKATQQIEIAEFVPSEKIDPVYFDKPYYLGPEKGADRAYRLLAEAMRRSGKTALARYAARGKQYLVQIRPLAEGGLVMQTLMYADEIRPFSEVGVEPAEVKEQELALAQQIIQQITTDEFKPEKYQDDVRHRIQEQIQRKVEGQEIQVDEPAAAPTQIIDLMEALKASLASKGLAPAKETAEAQDERKPAKRAAREPKGEKKASSRK